MRLDDALDGKSFEDIRETLNLSCSSDYNRDAILETIDVIAKAFESCMDADRRSTLGVMTMIGTNEADLAEEILVSMKRKGVAFINRIKEAIRLKISADSDECARLDDIIGGLSAILRRFLETSRRVSTTGDTALIVSQMIVCDDIWKHVEVALEDW